MTQYNIIPLGDHCSISIILRELNLRKQSYPFDWVMCTEQLNDTNILYNVKIINELIENNNIKEITKNYLGNGPTNETKIHNNIMFPHENGNIEEIYNKYERRFGRLYNNIINMANIFIFVTRIKYIEKNDFDFIVSSLLKYNSKNKIIFISGKNHKYINSTNYGENIIFKLIEYDINKFFDYDYTDFRPKIKIFLDELKNNNFFE